MNTCDTCKHWGPNPRGENHGNSKECACPAIRPATLSYGNDDLGNWEEMGRTWVPMESSQAALFTDSPINFCPGPKFGCVHWQANEQTDESGIPEIAFMVRCQRCGNLNKLAEPVKRADYANTNTPCQRPGCGAVQHGIGGAWRKAEETL